MRRRLLALGLFIIASLALGAQKGPVVKVDTLPSGTCGTSQDRLYDGKLYTCDERSDTWREPTSDAIHISSTISGRSAARFSGSDYLEVPIDDYTLGSGQVLGYKSGTILLHVKRLETATSGSYYLFELSPMTSRSQDSVRIYISGNTLTFEILDSSGTSRSITNTIDDLSWHSIHASWSLHRPISGTNYLELWVDGATTGNVYTSTTSTWVMTAAGSWDSSYQNYLVGADRAQANQAEAYIDFVLYHGEALSSADGAAYLAAPLTSSDFHLAGAWEAPYHPDLVIWAEDGADLWATRNIFEEASAAAAIIDDDSRTGDSTNATGSVETSSSEPKIFDDEVLKVVTTAASAYTYFNSQLLTDGTKVFRGWVRGDGASVDAKICVADDNADGKGYTLASKCVNNGNSSTTWELQELAYYFSGLPGFPPPPPNQGQVQLLTGAAGTAYLDRADQSFYIPDLQRGDMENFSGGTATGWTLDSGAAAQESTTVHGADSSQKLTRSGGTDAVLSQDVTLGGSDSWIWIVAYALTDGTSTAELVVRSGDEAYQETTTATSWTRLAVGFKDDGQDIEVELRVTTADGYAFFDDVLSYEGDYQKLDDGTSLHAPEFRGSHGESSTTARGPHGGGASGAVFGDRSFPWRGIETREPYVLTVGPNDGTGNYDTVAAAWAAIPDRPFPEDAPYTIMLLPGVHECSHDYSKDDCPAPASRQLKSKDYVRITGRDRPTTVLLNGLNFWDAEHIEIDSFTFGRPDTTYNNREVNVACEEDASTSTVADCSTDCGLEGGCSSHIWVHDATCYTRNICFRFEGAFDDRAFQYFAVTDSIMYGNEGVNFEKGNIRAVSSGNLFWIGFEPSTDETGYKQAGIEIGSIESDVDTWFTSNGDAFFIKARSNLSYQYAAAYDFFKVADDTMLTPKYTDIIGASVFGVAAADASPLYGMLIQDQATDMEDSYLNISGSSFTLLATGGSGNLYGIWCLHQTSSAGKLYVNISDSQVSTSGTTSGNKTDFRITGGSECLMSLNNVRRSDGTAPTTSATYGTNLFNLDTHYGRFGERLGLPLCDGDPPTLGDYQNEDACIDDTNNRLYIRVGGAWKYATLN